MEQGFGSLLDRRSAHPLSGATILQIVPVLDIGAAERVTIEIAAALAEAGARPLVASAGGRLVSELQAKGGIWLPFPAGSRNPISMALNSRKFARLLAAERVDIVHARSRAAAWVARGATRITRTPFVTSFTPGPAAEGATRRRYNSVMAQGDLVIAGSRMAATLVETLFPEAKDKIRVIHRGIDLQAFAPGAVGTARVQALRREWRIGLDERIILMAGRVRPGSGHKAVVEAVRLLATRAPRPLKLVIAGDAERRAAARDLDAAIARAGLGDVVRRVGYCADMPAALWAAAAAVVASTRPEATGRFVLEAQAMGTPVIGSDVGTLRELILAPPEVTAGQRTGWRAPPDDPAGFAAALEEVLGLGASALDGLALRARHHVETAFSAERMRVETLACYAALLGRDASSVR